MGMGQCMRYTEGEGMKEVVSREGERRMREMGEGVLTIKVVYSEVGQRLVQAFFDARVIRSPELAGDLRRRGWCD
jgi:hypothetical protein